MPVSCWQASSCYAPLQGYGRSSLGRCRSDPVFYPNSGLYAGCSCISTTKLLHRNCWHRYSRIPLSLLYSSLNKLFLLFLLALWRPVVVSSDSVPPLSQQYDASRWFNNSIVVSALEILDDDNLDREWVVRNILGGMAAGFGLRGACVNISNIHTCSSTPQSCSIATQFSPR